MADNGKPAANADASQDQAKGNDQGAGNGTQDAAAKGQDKTANTDKSGKQGKDLEAENVRLRGQIAELQKQGKEQADEFNKFKNALGAAVGLTTEGDGKTSLEDTVKALENQIAELKNKGDKADAMQMLNDVIDTFTDEDGKPLTDEVKNYLRSDLDVERPDREAIETRVKAKASKLKSLFGGRLQPAPERRPGFGGVSSGQSRPTANEILESRKKA